MIYIRNVYVAVYSLSEACFDMITSGGVVHDFEFWGMSSSTGIDIKLGGLGHASPPQFSIDAVILL